MCVDVVAHVTVSSSDEGQRTGARQGVGDGAQDRRLASLVRGLDGIQPSAEKATVNSRAAGWSVQSDAALVSPPGTGSWGVQQLGVDVHCLLSTPAATSPLRRKMARAACIANSGSTASMMTHQEGSSTIARGLGQMQDTHRLGMGQGSGAGGRYQHTPHPPEEPGGAGGPGMSVWISSRLRPLDVLAPGEGNPG